MIRCRNFLIFGLLGAFVATLAGCTGGGIARDNAKALERAIDVAQQELEAVLAASGLPPIPGEVEALGVRHGVPVVQYHAPADAEPPYTGAYGYGGWLGERGFAVYSAHAAGVDGDTYILAGDADHSYGAPGAASGFTGTWSGVMLGVDTGSSDADAAVLGHAGVELHSGASGATLDIEFSDVVDISSGDARDGHSWHGISVTDSSFEADDHSVSGQFYGDHHEDVIGECAYGDIVCAWGASRMEAGPGAPGDGTDGDGDMGDGDMGDGDMGDGDMGDGDMGDGDMGDGDMGDGDMGDGDMGDGDMGDGDMGDGDMGDGDMGDGDMGDGDMGDGDMG